MVTKKKEKKKIEKKAGIYQLNCLKFVFNTEINFLKIVKQINAPK